MIRVYRSLTEPLLLAGVPRQACIAWWTIAGSLTLGMKLWWLLPLGFAGHVGLVTLTRNDAMWFELLRGYLNQPERVEA